MRDRLLLGKRRAMIPIPRLLWRRRVTEGARGGRHSLEFMSSDHHRVRDFAVLELPRYGAPLAPELIADRLGLAPDRTVTILDELEKHMTFLFRNPQGAVTWAYPVTVDVTPHRLRFSSGEELYAA